MRNGCVDCCGICRIVENVVDGYFEVYFCLFILNGWVLYIRLLFLVDKWWMVWLIKWIMLSSVICYRLFVVVVVLNWFWKGVNYLFLFLYNFVLYCCFGLLYGSWCVCFIWFGCLIRWVLLCLCGCWWFEGVVGFFLLGNILVYVVVYKYMCVL